MLLLRNVNPSGVGKEGQYDSFVAGLLGGYVVFGRSRRSVSDQVWEHEDENLEEDKRITDKLLETIF